MSNAELTVFGPRGEAFEHNLEAASSDSRQNCLDASVHALFEAQVERAPDAVAVLCGDKRQTYRQLNAAANRLAHHLRRIGVGPDSLVAICVDRSLDIVVGLLGILKAGGAFLPLDPNYPRERFQFLLKDSETPVLVTQQALFDKLPEMAAGDRH